MRGDVFGLVASDLVLGFVLAGVVRVSLVIEIFVWILMILPVT